jgi:hypothetical protein
MNPVASIDPAVFSARVNPQRQAEQAGPNRVDRKPDRVPSDPCEPARFQRAGLRRSWKRSPSSAAARRGDAQRVRRHAE